MVEYSPPPAPLDGTYAALSHPLRRDILERLRRGDARVTELAAPYAVSLNAISKHVKALETAGLVHRRVVGRDHWLALEPAPLAAADAWLERYRVFWETSLDRLEALLRARRSADAKDPGT